VPAIRVFCRVCRAGSVTPPLAAMASSMVWRVDLSGLNGSAQLYIDEASGQLLDAITQGT
jgi:hypothetical protein